MTITQEIIPTRGHILGEILSEEHLTDSGLWIAPTLKKGIPPKRVRILAIGKPTFVKKENGKIKEIDGKEVTRWKICYDEKGNPKEKPWHYKTGDTIYVKPHTGIRQTINGTRCAWYRRDDVIGCES